MSRLWERHIRLEFGTELDPKANDFSVSGVAAMAAGNPAPMLPLSLQISQAMSGFAQAPISKTPTVGSMQAGGVQGRSTFGLVDVIEYYEPFRERWHIEFELNENIDGAVANSGVVTVFNISDQHLDMIKERAEMLRVYAGHGPAQPPLLFFGHIEDIQSEWQGSDRATHFHVTDVGNYHNGSQAYGTWPPPALASTIVKSLVNQIPIPKGTVKLGKEFAYRAGKMFEHNKTVMDALMEICKDTDSIAFIKRGVLYVLPADEGQRIPVVLRVGRGLVGEPEPERKATSHAPTLAGVKSGKPWKRHGKWHVVAMLNALFSPQVSFAVESRSLTGVVKVQSVQHVMQRQDFYSKMVVTEIS